MKIETTRGTDINIQANGITICYDDLGEGTIPIIFIHGFPFDKSSWNPQLEKLSQNHRAISYDIRGFGKSTGGNETKSISLFADDLINFMDALFIKKAIVCGLSMGGYILLNAVSRYPERFEAIVLSDTQCIADSAEAKDKRMKTISNIIASGLNGFADGFIKAVFTLESWETKKELVSRVRNTIVSTSSETVTDTLKAIASRDETCYILKNLALPTLILCGKEDVVTPLSQSEYLHSNIENSILQSIEGAGHLSNLEQAEVFNEHLEAFISGLPMSE